MPRDGLPRDVDELLRQDPAGVYTFVDEPTQACYLGAIAEMARTGRRTPAEIARQALEAARAATAAQERHVGYHLIGPGRRALNARLGLERGLRARLRAAAEHSTSGVYLALAMVSWTLMVVALAAYVASVGANPGTLAVSGLLGALLAVDPAVVVVRKLLLRARPARVLPRLGFRVVPDAYRTLVVVPTLLASAQDAREQLRRLERLAWVHADRNLRFALLADFLDAPQAESQTDEEIRGALADTVAALNARQRDATGDKFFALLRERRWSRSEGAYMGWERKRGKLEELGRLLREPDAATTFRWVFGDFAGACVQRRVRYVLTLDDGSWLPQGQVRELVRTAAHPLNQPHFDHAAGRVVRGYGILQPGLVSVPQRGQGLPQDAPLYARLMLGWLQPRPGVTPGAPARADGAVDADEDTPRDFEFDVFGAGRYVGKGLFDVDAFRAALDGTFPEGAVLSHDHLEGYLARTGAVYGLVMLEVPPARYATSRVQMHRWMRGDCQALAWLAPWVRDAGGRTRRNPLPVAVRLGLLHTVLGHLRAPVVLLTLLLGWTVWPGSPAVWTGVALGLTLYAPVRRLAKTLLGSAALLWPSTRPARGDARRLWRRCVNSLLRAGFDLAVFADHAGLAVDAMLRTLWRLLVSRRRLLEWNTHRQAERSTRDDLTFYLRSMAPSAVWGLVVLASVAVLRPSHLPWAMPWALAWTAAPFLCWRLDRP